MPDPDLDPRSPTALETLAEALTQDFDSGTRQRAREYTGPGVVEELQVSGPDITAIVHGSDDYETTLTLTSRGWSFACTCPVGEDGVNCKHAHAVGTLWLQQARNAAVPAPSVPSASAAANAAPPNAAHSPALPLLELLRARLGATKVHPSTLRAFADAWEGTANCIAAERAQRPANRFYTARLLERLFPEGSGYRNHQSLADAAHGSRTLDPSADPLRFWHELVALAERKGFKPPPWTAAFTDRDLMAREQRARDRARLLSEWTAHFEAMAAPSAEPLANGPIEVWLQLGEKRWQWLVEAGGQRQKISGAELTHRFALNPYYPGDTHEQDRLTPTAFALLMLWRGALAMSRAMTWQQEENLALLGRTLAHPLARSAVLGATGAPLALEPRRLTWRVRPHEEDAERIRLALAFEDGAPAPAELRYLGPHGPEGNGLYYAPPGHLIQGLPPPGGKKAQLGEADLPAELLDLPEVQAAAAARGVVLPPAPGRRTYTLVPLVPVLRLRTSEQNQGWHASEFVVLAQWLARDPSGAHHLAHDMHQWVPLGAAPALPPDTRLDRTRLYDARHHLSSLGFILRGPPDYEWTHHVSERGVGSFAEALTSALARLPAHVVVETDPALADLIAPPTRATWTADLAPSDEASGQDWFDLSLQLKPADTTLTPAEVKLLLAAKGAWVRLPSGRLRRLHVEADPKLAARLREVGLDPAALAADAKTQATTEARVRLHTLQLAAADLDERLAEEAKEKLRARVRALAEVPPAELPATLRAELRPYQSEGFAWLARLSALGLGGLLCDDMGLGKTVQALAWLLWLHARATPERPFRALIVCPKSVAPNWAREAERFAPSLRALALERSAALPRLDPASAGTPHLVIVNYAQLRLRADELKAVAWTAVVLDEAQAIKNPASQTAALARELRAQHRLVLTGTPVENRLLDLWSLFAFAFPGLLGTRTDFQRLYSEKGDTTGDARQRLAARVRPFLLRRTKSQVAADLPPRVEEDLSVELELAQRKLYDAELKRVRAQLLGVETDRALDAVRFNVLQSLLRLRQICCDPRLLDASAKAADSAKLEALLDVVSPLAEEGHRVLVFSQFVGMLELIAERLAEEKIAYLMLTGATENRQELVDQFQSAEGPPVFLLSLKAAGSGLNLTAASYVVLYDPWWNPAVEAQAIDRTHRIGQTAKVIAYRLLAKDTVEEKIRALQREKADVAAAIIGDAPTASAPPLDLATLRRVLG
jgi:superfamily II DNA or RNA helicase